jgi:pyruvate/2-oxoglutarate dehydrogenase complex dihydrolipoamide acyltransferase (E2) component
VGKTTDVVIPDIGDFDAVEIIEILVSEGDRVTVEESLLTLESDKATMEIPSPYTGEVKRLLVAHPEIDDSQTLIVNFNSFAPSSLDFFVYTFTHTTNWVRYHEIKHEVLLKIYDIITAHDAEVAFPTSTVHLPEAAMRASEG